MNYTLTGLSRGNILLVDDTPNNLRLLSAMLSDQGYEVRRVINGQMALKTAQANPPDLILLDIKMPDMNGYEVCQHLKAIAQTASIPVIFISALDEVLDKVKAFAVGGVDYITKPFSEEEVFVRVENILTIRRLQKQLETQNQELNQKVVEQRQLEAKLLQHQARCRSVFNNSLVGMFQIRTSDSLLLMVNQRFADLFGFDSVEAIAQKQLWVGQFVHPQDWHSALEELQSLTDSAATPPHSYTTHFYQQNHTIFQASFSIWQHPEGDRLEGMIQAISSPLYSQHSTL